MTVRRDQLSARLIGPSDEAGLRDLFAELDTTYFQPHAMDARTARSIATHQGRDVYGVVNDGDRFVAYGMLRGWDEGYAVPSLGVAVRTLEQGRGYGRQMMAWLIEEARRRGAAQIRLRVHPDNARARRLYESLGWVDVGEERDERVMTLDLTKGAASSSS